MVDNHQVILEYAYHNNEGVRFDFSVLFSSETRARDYLNIQQSCSGIYLIYAKIRKFRYVHDTCLKYNDKGELENEFYINPNKKT